jgi:hypothetical protein
VQYRKQLGELVSTYELHPDFRDLYVEGQWDKRLIDWFLRDNGVRGVVIYDIDSVDIPSEILGKYDLPEGKKQRVVALACELQHSIVDHRQVTCVADKDYDTILDVAYSSPLLMMTDFSCQEMYFLNETSVDKFLALVVRSYPFDAWRLIGEIVPTLQELHLMRAANLSLKLYMQWLPFNKCCEYRSHSLYFNRDEFIRRYLSKNGKLELKDEFVRELERLRQKQTNDPREHISKGDLFCLLAQVLPTYCKDHAFHRPEYISRTLAACVEHSYLSGQPLYKQLLAKLQT